MKPDDFLNRDLYDKYLKRHHTHYRRNGTPYPEGDEGLFEWAHDFHDLTYKVVRQETLPNGIWISTVWLGIDHNFALDGPPLIFETMAWSANGDALDFQERYATEDDAIIGHLQAIDLFKNGVPEEYR